MTADWPAAVPALLAGAVGAAFGWRDAGYLPCPIAFDRIGGNAVRVVGPGGRAVGITPGVRGHNPWGEPDTMRGEELQIAGWGLEAGARDALVVLPGTHCKWAQVAGGEVTQFHSAISGELFALLREDSVLVDRAGQNAPHDAAAFAEGAALTRRADDVDLAALLFTARARQATGTLTRAAALSFVSGIIIGCDVRTAMRHYRGAADIFVIGDADLAMRYRDVLIGGGHAAAVVNGDAAMRAGLLAAARMQGWLD